MLRSGKIAVFVLFSLVLHAGFALLFSEVRLSFTPPTVKELSLAIMARGGEQGEIIQSEAAWPTPSRLEPEFSAERMVKALESDTTRWTRFGVPAVSHFTPRETLAPEIDLGELAQKAHPGSHEQEFSQLAPERKTMPVADFALGPALPEIFEAD